MRPAGRSPRTYALTSRTAASLARPSVACEIAMPEDVPVLAVHIQVPVQPGRVED